MEAVPNHTNHFESLLSKAGEYAEARVALLKLKVADKASDTVSDVAATIVFCVFMLFFLLTLSVGIALLLGEWLGKSYYGFFIVAGIYGIAGIIIFANRKNLIKAPVSNFIIHKILKTAE